MVSDVMLSRNVSLFKNKRLLRNDGLLRSDSLIRNECLSDEMVCDSDTEMKMMFWGGISTPLYIFIDGPQ